MATKQPGLLLSIVAFVLYITGGFGVFGGFGLIAIMGRQDLFGWGEAKTIGYFLICIGLCFSVIGVLLLRIVRNRTNILLIQSLTAKENKQ